MSTGHLESGSIIEHYRERLPPQPRCRDEWYLNNGATPGKGAPGPLLGLPRFSVSPHDAFNVRQEHRQQSQQRHEGTRAIYEADAGVIRKFTQ